jgi:transcriptional regulator with XRE-family HTH domain
MTELAEKVKDTLKKKNLTRKAFAEFSGVSPFTLRNLLEDKTEQKPETVNKINKALSNIDKKPKKINGKENVTLAVISYETLAEAELEVSETVIDPEKNITQREYKNPKIKKTLEIRSDKFKIVRTLGECVKIEPAPAYVK